MTVYNSLSITSTTGDISSIFSRNSEVNASEYLENIEEMFPHYYMHSDICSRYNNCAKCQEKVNI